MFSYCQIRKCYKPSFLSYLKQRGDLMSITIYSTKTCPWCEKTKKLLISRKVKFVDLDVATNAKARKDMVRKSGQLGVPVIDINGKIIVGFDQKAIEKALAKKR